MIREAVQRARREALRAGREARAAARRAAEQFRVTTRDGGVLRRTRIDLDKAQIVYSDAEGEMRVETVDGKKMLTAKDPQGRLLFSGPIEKKEDLDKIPAEVRKRFDKLEQKDLAAPEPAPAPHMGGAYGYNYDGSDVDDNDNDADSDNDNDNDNDMDDDSDDDAPAAAPFL